MAGPERKTQAASILPHRASTPYEPKSLERPTVMTTPVISLKDVSLSLDGNAGRVDILHQINLDVLSGETLGLVGPSGSGKSSLLMLMGGLERASSGQVQVLGQDLSPMNEDQLARFRRGTMGVVFQSFHLIPTLT